MLCTRLVRWLVKRSRLIAQSHELFNVHRGIESEMCFYRIYVALFILSDKNSYITTQLCAISFVYVHFLNLCHILAFPSSVFF